MERDFGPPEALKATSLLLWQRLRIDEPARICFDHLSCFPLPRALGYGWIKGSRAQRTNPLLEIITNNSECLKTYLISSLQVVVNRRGKNQR